MKIILVDIPIKEVGNGYSVVHKEILFPSLGLYYLKEYVKQNNSGIDIEVINLIDTTLDEAGKIIISKKPDMVGVSCFTDRRAGVFEFFAKIKKANEKIITITGGPHASLFPEQIFTAYKHIDYIIIGEGEITFNALIKNLANNENIEKINGLAYKQNNKIIITAPRAAAENLDELPYPRYKSIDKISIKFTHYDGRYEFNGKPISQLKTASIITSRGCPFKCTYCSTTAYWGRKVRYRSAESVVEEIEYLNKTHNVEFINIVDDAFTINRKRVFDICELLIQKKINICWICETNVKTIDEEMLKIMKTAGCFAINYGVESGAPGVLANIKKNITPEEIISAVSLAHKTNIIPDIFLMVGNQGETTETINQTLKILKKAKPSSGGWGILTIFPGTELYADCKNKNYISDNYWLTDNSSPFYLYEHSYLQMQIFLSKIKLFFLWKDKKYKLWLRYYLLKIRDIIFLKTGVKLSFKKGVEFLFNDKRRFKNCG